MMRNPCARFRGYSFMRLRKGHTNVRSPAFQEGLSNMLTPRATHTPSLNWAAPRAFAALALLFSVTLVGCNTVRGIGEDITYASDRTAEAITGEDHPRDDDD